MSHQHYCDYAGHEWECTGAALRPLAGDTEPSVCMCAIHQVPLADGDHNECPIELLACPEHCEQQLRGMRTIATSDPRGIGVGGGRSSSKDSDGYPVVGFCLWCNMDFHSMEKAKAHHAHDSKACVAFREWKDKA